MRKEAKASNGSAENERAAGSDAGVFLTAMTGIFDEIRGMPMSTFKGW